ncbi:hypothetical protein [Nonomuraea insulae]|uniref:Uncharacterized protein n=1 Tax=Nonomuraea insulae TaxID=1616787 RepID=A0ABW1D103_9ACTN
MRSTTRSGEVTVRAGAPILAARVQPGRDAVEVLVALEQLAGVHQGLAGGQGAMRSNGIEFAVLALRRRQTFITPWIRLVVGVHFWPLAVVLGNSWLFVLSALLTATAVVTVLMHRQTGLPPSAITGAGAGACLLGTAAWDAFTLIDRGPGKRVPKSRKTRQRTSTRHTT